MSDRRGRRAVVYKRRVVLDFLSLSLSLSVAGLVCLHCENRSYTGFPNRISIWDVIAETSEIPPAELHR